MAAQAVKILVKVAVAAALTCAGSTLGKHAEKELEVLLKSLK